LSTALTTACAAPEPTIITEASWVEFIMDNVTHTLIGALLGETLARTTQPDPRGLPDEVRRNLLVAAGAIGSNLPDVDVL
jgi:hypothetical protein